MRRFREPWGIRYRAGVATLASKLVSDPPVASSETYFDGSKMSRVGRSSVPSKLLTLVAVGVLTAGCAAAPPPRTLPSFFVERPSWSALSILFGGENIVIGLRPGATVPGVAGNEFDAVFQESDADTLTVRRGIVLPGIDLPVGVTILPRDDVLYVRTVVSEPDSTLNGTIIGLLIGTAAIAVTLGVLCTERNDCPLGEMSVIFGVPAAAAGAFIGRSYDRKRTGAPRLVTIYEARGSLRR